MPTPRAAGQSLAAPIAVWAATLPVATPRSSSETSSEEQIWCGPTISGGSPMSATTSVRTLSAPRQSSAA